MMEKLFCMRLNTAGVVLGWLGVVGSIVMTILFATILGNADVIAHRIVENVNDAAQKYDEIHMAIIVVCSVYLAITAMNLMASSLLVLGTMKERHLMLLPWLINSGIGLVFSIIYQFFLVVVTFTGDNFPLPGLMLSFLVLGLQIYVYCGIYSLFKKIQLTREQQRPLMVQSEAAAVPNQGNSYPSYTKI